VSGRRGVSNLGLRRDRGIQAQRRGTGSGISHPSLLLLPFRLKHPVATFFQLSI
jgi:hypothetical protein